LRKIKEKVRGEDRPKKAYLEKDNIFLPPFFEILAFSARHYLSSLETKEVLRIHNKNN
jgi:hypothetical protein